MESTSRAMMTPGAMGWNPAVMAAMPPETVSPMMMGKPVPAAMQGAVPVTGGMMMGMPQTGMAMGMPQTGMMMGMPQTGMMMGMPQAGMMMAMPQAGTTMGMPVGAVSPAQAVVPTQMAPTTAGMLPVIMLTLPAGAAAGAAAPTAGALEWGGPTLAAATREASGAFKVPGWSVALDTPLLQGAVHWPALMGAMHWPGMSAAMHLPTVRMAHMTEGGQAAMHWPAVQVALMPDDPAE